MAPRSYLGRGSSYVPPGEVPPLQPAGTPPRRGRALGHVGGVDRGHDANPDVVATLADLAVYVHGDCGTFLLGELAPELAADGSPTRYLPARGTLSRTG